MIAHKVWTGVAVIGALALSAGLASAVVPAAQRAKAPNPSAAVHTATTHHRVHRQHHHAPGAVIATNRLAPIRAVDFPAEPAAPQRQRPHRATLPVLAQFVRHAPTSRYGPRHAPAALGQVATIALDARALEAHRDATPDPRIVTVSGGRGPPRGSPSGPSRGRATPAPASADDPDACASPLAGPTSRNAPHPFPSQRLFRSAGVRLYGAPPRASSAATDVPEVGSCRLHADRPEGATACLVMPSNGGTPCPASSPSLCSSSRPES
jgi:hypothetical protein